MKRRSSGPFARTNAGVAIQTPLTKRRPIVSNILASVRTLLCSALRNGSFMVAASTVPRLSAGPICGKPSSTKRIFVRSAPLALSHALAPSVFMSWSPEVPTILPSRSLARRSGASRATDSTVVGASETYSAPEPTITSGIPRVTAVATPIVLVIPTSSAPAMIAVNVTVPLGSLVTSASMPARLKNPVSCA
jgi:hypothetical protein